MGPSSHTASAVLGCGATGEQVVLCGGTQLVVTLHRGAQRHGAVAVLMLSSKNTGQSTEQESNGRVACVAACW
jgi:hypothetical protein